MNTKTKRLLIAIAALFLLFIFTNPSYKDFKEFSADYSVTSKELLLHRHEVVRQSAPLFRYPRYK